VRPREAVRNLQLALDVGKYLGENASLLLLGALGPDRVGITPMLERTV